MLGRFALAFAAAALLASGTAVAAADASQRADDMTYPGSPALFTNGVDNAPIVTPDVTYPGPHGTVVTVPPPAAQLAVLGRYDDTTYPHADEAAATPATAVVAGKVDDAGRDQPIARCGCC